MSDLQEVIDCVLFGNGLPDITQEEITIFLYDHIQLLLPISSKAPLFSIPSISQQSIVNLRYYARLNKMLFSRLDSLLTQFPSTLSKGDYYCCVEHICNESEEESFDCNHKHYPLFIEFYDRVYNLLQQVNPDKKGIRLNNLLILLSALYRFNSSLITRIYTILTSENQLSFSVLDHYYQCIFMFINEVQYSILL